MSFAQIDMVADSVNKIFPLALLLAAIYWQKARAGVFLLKTLAAFVICQQIAKLLQKTEIVSNNFPSTHFAVCLVFAVSLAVLRPRIWPLAVAIPIFYGALMLYVYARFGQYHTPLELLGAFYALPITLLLHSIGTKKSLPMPDN